MIHTDQRFTPSRVLDAVRSFAPIGLDPCTTPDNPVGAEIWHDGASHGCGLSCPWVCAAGSVAFVNPPYSRGQLPKWADKARHEWHANGTESILLVPADTSTASTQFLLRHATAVAFWRRRLRFAGAAGVSAAKFASALFYFGERRQFGLAFREDAIVVDLQPGSWPAHA